jgi:hypothetical protein
MTNTNITCGFVFPEKHKDSLNADWFIAAKVESLIP